MTDPAFRRLISELEHAGAELTHPGEIAAWLHQHLGHNPYHDPQNTTATTAGAKMSLTTITDDVRNDLTEGAEFVEGWIGRLRQAAPGILSTAESVGSSTVGSLVEAVAGKVLPADVEAELASIVKTYVARFGQDAPAAEAPQPVAATPATPAS